MDLTGNAKRSLKKESSADIIDYAIESKDSPVDDHPLVSPSVHTSKCCSSLIFALCQRAAIFEFRKSKICHFLIESPYTPSCGTRGFSIILQIFRNEFGEKLFKDGFGVTLNAILLEIR